MAAEQWCEYQKCYNKYGLGMRPELPERERRTSKAEPVTVNFKDKVRILFLLVVFGIMGIGLIITAAYSTQVKLETNRVIAQAEEVQGEIDNLNLEIKKSGNISFVEEIAVNRLGMIYPEFSQIAFINANESEGPEFAAVLRQIAFEDGR